MLPQGDNRGDVDQQEDLYAVLEVEPKSGLEVKRAMDVMIRLYDVSAVALIM